MNTTIDTSTVATEDELTKEFQQLFPKDEWTAETKSGARPFFPIDFYEEKHFAFFGKLIVFHINRIKHVISFESRFQEDKDGDSKPFDDESGVHESNTVFVGIDLDQEKQRLLSLQDALTQVEQGIFGASKKGTLIHPFRIKMNPLLGRAF